MWFLVTLIFGWFCLPRLFSQSLQLVSLDIRKDMSIFAVPNNNWFPTPGGGHTSSLDSLIIYWNLSGWSYMAIRMNQKLAPFGKRSTDSELEFHLFYQVVFWITGTISIAILFKLSLKRGNNTVDVPLSYLYDMWRSRTTKPVTSMLSSRLLTSYKSRSVYSKKSKKLKKQPSYFSSFRAH